MTRSASELTRKSKRTKILYWVLTGIFCLAMLMDGMAGLVREKTGQEIMRQLGYPVYVLTLFGTAKILGAIAILQTRYYTIKEWAYAGFTINFIGASASWAFIGKDAGFMLPPLVALGFLFLTYALWKRVEALKRTI